MKKLTFVITLSALFLLAGSSQAQQFDLGFGVGTVVAPATGSNSSGSYTQTIGGGTYLSFGGDFLVRHNFGIDIDGSIRASQALYAGVLPFRPVFYDFNAIWAPKLGRKASAELVGGVGVEGVREYGSYNCNYYIGCTNYTSENHFMADFGAGLRYYFHGNAFIRPEVRVYVTPDQNSSSNLLTFSGVVATRVGGTIGYSFGRGW